MLGNDARPDVSRAARREGDDDVDRFGRPDVGARGRGKGEQHHNKTPHDAIHSITWSARVSMVGGMARPSALAVLRLMTNSNLVGCCTGRSAGLAPLRILST